MQVDRHRQDFDNLCDDVSGYHNIFDFFPFQTKKLMMLKEQFASSNKLQANPLEKPFDDQCFTELSEVFNKNSKWKSVATVLDYEDYVPTWHPLRNPTKALLMYAEVCHCICLAS